MGGRGGGGRGYVCKIGNILVCVFLNIISW